MHIDHRLEFCAEADLSQLNTLKVPARARCLVRVLERAALAALRHDPRMQGKRAVLGGGSNVVLPSHFDGALIQQAFSGFSFSTSGDGVDLVVDAGMNWHALVLECVERGYFGIENLALIPGSCGAAPIQNIGAYGVELSDFLQAVEVFDWHSGEFIWWPRANLALGYRDSIFKRLEPGRFLITRVQLRLNREAVARADYAGLKDELMTLGVTKPTPRDVMHAVIRVRSRKLPHPNQTPNAGSFFKNPYVSESAAQALSLKHAGMPMWREAERVKVSAAWLIEQSGLKGLAMGKCAISAQHALVLINHGADAIGIRALADHVIAKVHERFGIDLECEPTWL
jgi:UDP-N-acetylmuramate dehydrogenase